MNGALLEAFRHNGWANKQLLASCRGLSQNDLTSSATGTYGDILATFNHIVFAESGYARRLAGDAPAWATERKETSDLDQLESRIDDMNAIWEQYAASGDTDAERVIPVDDGALYVRAGVIIAQAIHHGSVHREQICAILTRLGIEPPDIQAWAYAEATARMWKPTS